MAIDKQTAGILYSYNYKLKDSEGNVWDISSVNESYSYIESETNDYSINLIRLSNLSIIFEKCVDFSEIGTTYKILARPLEMLTKEIESKVPIVELAKLSCMFEVKEYEVPQLVYEYGILKSVYVNMLDDKKDRVVWCLEYNFNYNSFMADHCCISEGKCNQLALFDKLKEWHFNIGFPENTTTDLI